MSQHSYSSYAAGGLDDLYRPPRYLPAHTDPSRLPVFPKVQNKGTSPTTSALKHIDRSQKLHDGVGGSSHGHTDQMANQLYKKPDLFLHKE